MSSNKKILIIEDEKAIREMIRFALSSTGFEIIEAGNATEAKKKIATNLPDLILLDWMLPDISGIEYLKKLRNNNQLKNIPVIMLTAKAEEENKVKGLDAGADDYITKPFSPNELIARIKTIFRRGVFITPDGIIQFHQLKLNVDTYEVSINDIPITLTQIEYKLLHFFLTHQDRVYHRSQLLDYIWGVGHFIEERTVDVTVRRLRERLRTQGYDTYIKTIRSIGYQFSEK
jgi:two-component system phosphate regulon response regulator PhoB